MNTFTTPARSPERSSTREENARETNGSGSTPRVKVTKKFLPRPGPIARKLFREPWTRKLRLHLVQFKNLELWRGALREAIFTGAYVFASIVIVSGSVLWGSSLPGRVIVVAAALHTLMFIIYLLAALSCKHPSSTGVYTTTHLNPAVTLLVILRGDLGPVSGLLTITAQFAGAILAALAAKELVPQDRRDLFMLGGCFTKRKIVVNGTPVYVGFNDHQGFLCEFIFSFTFLYFTYLLFESKQMRLVGVRTAVMLISANIGFNIYLAASLRSGYSGAQFNPARCLGPAVAYGQPLWDRLWQPFLAPFVAAVAVAFLSVTAPPDHVEVYAANKDIFSQFRRLISSDDDLASPQSPELDSNTVYEVPSAARRFADSPQTPEIRPPPDLSHEV